MEMVGSLSSATGSSTSRTSSGNAASRAETSPVSDAGGSRHEVSGLLERARELERVERIPARPLVKLHERVPAKRDAEALAEQTVRRPDAQRAEPQPPQPLLRKRTLEPERNRLRAVAAARDENRGRRRRKPAKRKRRAQTPTPHRATAHHRPPPAAARFDRSPSSWNTANAIARSSGADPSTSSSNSAAESARRCGDGNRASPSGRHGPQQVGERSEREGRLGARRTARENGKTAIPRLRHRGLEQRRLPDPRLAVQHERPREVAVDESRDSGELLIPTDDSRGRDGHDIVDYGTRWDSRLGAGSYPSGNGFRASAGSTWAVTQTGVVA